VPDADDGDSARELIELYPTAVRDVYGFLLPRCGGDARLAEDLTADAFMAAVEGVQRGKVEEVTTGWLITVARRRLVDHWRKQEREARKLRVVAGGLTETDDPWDDEVDVVATRAALDELTGDHRAVLTLRYLDGLSVTEVADLMVRSVAATDSLLQRARAALRSIYLAGGPDAD
jgi:RNA polymerase sigma-70 factor (ECF subfamily)